MRGADQNAALAYRGSRRRPFGPGRQTRSADATAEQSPIEAFADRAKRAAKIDVVPFVPSRSPICRAADLVMVSAVTVGGLAAALAALVRQVM